MSNYSEDDFCSPDDGLDYVFARLSAIYGAPFNRHFDGIDPNLVRQEWKFQLGKFLTYRPTMDYAISMLDGEFIPSAIKFRKLCNDAPAIPVKPLVLITKQQTQEELAEVSKNKAEAIAKLKLLRNQFK
jgi:hypothetical protein